MAGGKIVNEMPFYLLVFKEPGERDPYHEDLPTLSFISFAMNLLILPRLHLGPPVGSCSCDVFTVLWGCVFVHPRSIR
jgi:hypothetical protein